MIKLKAEGNVENTEQNRSEELDTSISGLTAEELFRLAAQLDCPPAKSNGATAACQTFYPRFE